MTQENKELLLKDLCARLQYEVKVQVFNYGVETVETLYQIDLDGYISTIESDELKYSYKPYLFPMSNMTEEQKREYIELLQIGPAIGIDWLNAHRFDYRGLIEKGLAIEAPEGMYN